MSRVGILVSPERGLRALGPGVLAAASFGLSNICTKIALLAGADALTLATSRGVLGTLLVLAWLRAAPPLRRHSPRARLIALGIGLLFAGNLFLVYSAIRVVAVPIAILSYFVYPLLTGIVGAAIGLERLRPVSAASAVVALLGLALMLGADTAHVAWLGVGLAIGAALCRVATLLVTRAALSQADSRLTTWYSMLSSTAVLLMVSVAVGAPAFPHGAAGWAGFLGVCLCSTVSMLALFASTVRIGAFRTALVMNLEPVVSTLLSIVVLGEVLTAVQFVGAAIMLAALCAFQVRRE
jgi:drug/metabolite transporter (DMT)-like permease